MARRAVATRKKSILQASQRLKETIVFLLRQGDLKTGYNQLDILRMKLGNSPDLLEQTLTDIALAVTDEGTDVEQRKAAFEEIQKIDLGHPDALMLYALGLSEFGQYKSVIEKFEQALQIEPDDVWVLLGYGLFLRDLKKYDVAIEKFEQALQIEPDNVDVLQQCGLVLFQSAQYEAAIEKFEQVLQIKPDDVDTLNNYGIALAESGQYETAIAKFEQALKIKPDDIDTLNNYGRALSGSGQYEAAIEKYEQVLLIESENGTTLNNYGMVLIYLEQYNAAIEKFEQALQIKPDNFKALNNYGLALNKSGQYEAAIEKFEQALQIEPDDVKALNNYGLALTKSGRYEEAIEMFEQALQIEPDDVAALIEYGTALIHLGQYEAAIEKFKQVLGIEPDNVAALTNYGTSLLYLGQDNAAIEKFKQALQIEPDDVTALTNYGVTLLYLGQHEAASEKFEQALQIEPDNITALAIYGASLLYLGQNNAAIKKFERLLTKPSLPQNIANPTYLNLGTLYYRIKSEAKGKEYFDLAIQNSTDQDATKIEVARGIFADTPYSQEGVAILQEIAETSPYYAQAFKSMRLNLSPKAYYQMFNTRPAESHLRDTEMLNRALYHKIANEVSILKEIVYEIVADYKTHDGILRAMIANIDQILSGINQRRELEKAKVKSIPTNDYDRLMEIISETAQNISDFVNNELAVVEEDIRFALDNESSPASLQQELRELLAQVKITQEALNDLKTINEGIRIKPGRFKVQELFENWARYPKLQKATISVEIKDGETEFNSDEQKIKSFLNELVENSLKYNPDQDDLVIRITSEIGNGLNQQKTLTITFSDNGQGIPPAKKADMFLPLKTTSELGSGLGLFIIKRTLEEMGGYIDETGQNGVHFEISIPETDA